LLETNNFDHVNGGLDVAYDIEIRVATERLGERGGEKAAARDAQPAGKMVPHASLGASDWQARRRGAAAGGRSDPFPDRCGSTSEAEAEKVL